MRERGATLVEYVLLLVCIALLAVASVTVLGGAVKKGLSTGPASTTTTVCNGNGNGGNGNGHCPGNGQ